MSLAHLAATTGWADVVAGDVHQLIPALVAAAALRGRSGFLQFFAASIRNRNTSQDYDRAVTDFLAWCEDNNRVPSFAAVRFTWRRGLSRGLRSMRATTADRRRRDTARPILRRKAKSPPAVVW
jgi:hypothetical protein